MSRILALLAGLMLAGAVSPVTAAEIGPRHVSVEGLGAVDATPDMAEISTGVTARADSARRALDASSAGMRRLMETLRQAGIAEGDIRTSNFNLSPWYEPRKGNRPRRISGYQVSNQVTVRIREISRLGAILDAVVTAGANRVSGVRFGVAEPRSLMDEARRLAVADARRRAALYAEAAGAKLGTVIAIEEHGARPRPPRMMALETVRAASVPVAPGTQRLTVSITVRFALE